jgi:hypothetical protein
VGRGAGRGKGGGRGRVEAKRQIYLIYLDLGLIYW